MQCIFLAKLTEHEHSYSDVVISKITFRSSFERLADSAYLSQTINAQPHDEAETVQGMAWDESIARRWKLE